MEHDARTGRAVQYGIASNEPSAPQPRSILQARLATPYANRWSASSPGKRYRKATGLVFALGVALLVVLLAAVFVVARFMKTEPESTERWFEYTSKDGQFSIRFPLSPTSESVVRDTAEGKRLVHSIACVSGGVMYQVSYFDSEFSQDMGYEVDREKTFRQFEELNKVKLESWDRVLLGDHMANKGTFVREDGLRAEILVVLISRRVFNVSCEGLEPHTPVSVMTFASTFRYNDNWGTVTPSGHVIRADELTRDVALRNWKALFVPGRVWHEQKSPDDTIEVTREGVHVVSVDGMTAQVQRFDWGMRETPDPDAKTELVRFESQWAAYVATRDANPPDRMVRPSGGSMRLLGYVWGTRDGNWPRIQYVADYAPFLTFYGRSKTGTVRLIRIFDYGNAEQIIDEGGRGATSSGRGASEEKDPALHGPLLDVVAFVGEEWTLRFDVSNGCSPFVWSHSGAPKGASRNDMGAASEISGKSSAEGVWTVEVKVTDAKGRMSSKAARLIVKSPSATKLVENAGPMEFTGGNGRVGVRYRGEIKIEPPVARKHLTLSFDQQKFPKGLTAEIVSDRAVEIAGCPLQKGEFTLQLTLTAVLPAKNYAKVESTLAVTILVDAGPHEPFESLFGETTVIAFEGGEYGSGDTLLIPAFDACLAALPESRWVEVTLGEYGEWRPVNGYPCVFPAGSDDVRVARYRIRSWSHFKRDQGAAGLQSWESLAKSMPRYILSARQADSLVIVTTLKTCDTEHGINSAKAALEALKKDGKLKIGIVTTRRDVPNEFRKWLQSNAIGLVILNE